jgi:hypothetical protein
LLRNREAGQFITPGDDEVIQNQGARNAAKIGINPFFVRILITYDPTSANINRLKSWHDSCSTGHDG